MAGQSPLVMKFEMPKNTMEIVSKSKDKSILQKYFVNSNNTQNNNTVLPYMDPAIIDLQLLLDSEDELQRFGSLLNSWGCLQLVNHGISSSKLDQVLQISKEFFELPLEEKQKYSIAPDQVEGWGSDAAIENSCFNWNDRLILRVYPLDSRSPQQFWPDKSLPKFSEIVEEYVTELMKIQEKLFRAISKLFKLKEGNLLNTYGKDGVIISRFNYYPPCPYPGEVVGFKPHSDVHTFTLLLQDKNVEGLQVQKDDQWFKVPLVQDALVVNVGDMLEIISNGRIKSLFHKVKVNEEKERISVGFAFGPPPNMEIGPFKELIDEERPQIYKTVKDYINIVGESLTLGKKALDRELKFQTPLLRKSF